jgi:hypothetical protein
MLRLGVQYERSKVKLSRERKVAVVRLAISEPPD